MNRILKNSLIIGGILVATTGLVVYFRKQFKLLADSCSTIVGGIIHNIGTDEVSLTLMFKIKNISDLTIKVENMTFDIYVNNLFVTKILRKDKQTLLSHADIIFKLDVQFAPKDLMKAGLANITPLIYDKDKLIITVKGNLDAEMGAVRINKYEFEEKISLKELMSPSPNTKKC